MSTENFIDPNHPHGPPDPRWITEDGRCLLCSDSYQKECIAKLEGEITTLRFSRAAAVEQEQRTRAECNRLRGQVARLKAVLKKYTNCPADPEWAQAMGTDPGTPA